jgi:NhaP-type Na+/H+ and K+/H+ antiporter
MIADILIPQWLASLVVGAFITASGAATVWTLKKLHSQDKRLQHLENRMGTNPPFGS